MTSEIPFPYDRPKRKKKPTKPQKPPVVVVRQYRNGELLSDRTFQPYFFPLDSGQDFEGFDNQGTDANK